MFAEASAKALIQRELRWSNWTVIGKRVSRQDFAFQ